MQAEGAMNLIYILEQVILKCLLISGKHVAP